MTTTPDRNVELTSWLDGEPVRWSVEGPFVRGTERIEVDADGDLTAGTTWARQGFTVVEHLDGHQHDALVAGITAIVRRDLAEIGVEVDDHWTLETYHRFVDDALHQAYTARHRCFVPMDDFPIDTGALEDLVSRTVGRRVGLMPVPDRPPSFLIRVVRPRSTDHSPPHRDHWLDHLRGTIAAYLPVVGSGPDSSLPLVPGSHRWPDDMLLRTDGPGVANGVRYGIPAIAASDRRIRMQRPDPGGGELLVFSPYLVHGGAVNRQPDTTRVSLELRFEEPR